MFQTKTARAIGYDTLDWINKTGRLPAAPPAVVTGPPITLPADTRVGRDAPLIGHAEFNVDGQADLDLALQRVARAQEREAEKDARTRTAGTRR